jgi:hypothetical protein
MTKPIVLQEAHPDTAALDAAQTAKRSTVITERHARGLLKEVIRDHSEMFSVAWMNAYRSAIDSSSKRTHIGRKVDSIAKSLEPTAIFMIKGNDKRRGLIRALAPAFQENPGLGWALYLDTYELRIRPGSIPERRVLTSYGQITGHAIERVFQRARITSWHEVVEEIRIATVVMAHFGPLLQKAGAKRCAAPTRSGLLVGEIGEDSSVVYKTYVKADEDDRADFQRIRRDLVFAADRLSTPMPMFLAASPADAQAAEEVFSEVLASHDWLMGPHRPGQDMFSRAEESRLPPRRP